MAAKINLSRSDSQHYFIWEPSSTRLGLTMRLLLRDVWRSQLPVLGLAHWVVVGYRRLSIHAIDNETIVPSSQMKSLRKVSRLV